MEDTADVRDLGYKIIGYLFFSQYRVHWQLCIQVFNFKLLTHNMDLQLYFQCKYFIKY